MSYYRIIDPVETAFFSWLNDSPDSYHPYDRGRFYSFADTAWHYKKSYGRKWLNKEFFISQCKKYKPLFDDECILYYWNRFEIIKDYHEFKKPKQLVKEYVSNDNYSSYYAQIVVNGEIETIPIDKESFHKKHLSRTAILKIAQKNHGG